MRNCEMQVEKGQILVIRVDLSQDHGASNSKRSTIIGSTEGNLPVHDGKGFVENTFVNCTVFRRRSKEEILIRGGW